MVRNTVNKRVTRVYSPEMLAEARSLYQGGMSLEAVGKKLGIPYSTLRYRGWVDNWGVRAKGKRDPRVEAAKAQRLARRLKREERLMMAEAALVKAEDLEVLARKSLVADSARAKVMISRRLREVLMRLDDPTIPVRSAAQALGALAPIIKLIYRWHEEPPPVTELKAANHPLHNMINLGLQATPPEMLKQMALAKRGSLTPEHDGQGGGPSPIRERTPESPGVDGPLGEKGDPEKLAEEKHPDRGVYHGSDAGVDHQENSSARSWKGLKPELDEILRPQLPLSAPRQPAQDAPKGNPPSVGSPPLSPQERRKQQLEELARLRAEWRGQRR